MAAAAARAAAAKARQLPAASGGGEPDFGYIPEDKRREREEELEGMRLQYELGEMEKLREDLRVAREHAAIAAKAGKLDAKDALKYVEENQVAFSYRSSLKSQHAMRLDSEEVDGKPQDISKCLCCGMTWQGILKAAAEDPEAFFYCQARAGWDSLRAQNKKESWGSKKKTAFTNHFQ